MFKKLIVIFILGGLVIACDGADKIKKPDNLIPKDKMGDILYDLYIINASKGVNRSLLEKSGLKPESYILSKYNIDSTQFASSNSYYAFKTEDYQDIIEKVKARLEKEKEGYEEIRKAESDSSKVRRDFKLKIGKEKKDSIKKEIDRKGID